MRLVSFWPEQEFVDCFPRAYVSPRQLMPATALIRLNEVTNELMELARASRANKVRSHALVAGRGNTKPQSNTKGMDLDTWQRHAAMRPRRGLPDRRCRRLKGGKRGCEAALQR